MWRKRYNHVLYVLFNEPDIVKYIKVNRMGWAGHVMRMGNNGRVKKSLILGQKEQGGLEDPN